MDAFGGPSRFAAPPPLLFANPGVASALIHPSDVIAQVIFTPPLVGWSIWIGIAISSRSSEIRVAQRLGSAGG
jgi:ABC-2 type transport system permease protein